MKTKIVTLKEIQENDMILSPKHYIKENPICPKCKEEIEYLFARSTKSYAVSLNDFDHLDWFSEEDNQNYVYFCPECDEEILFDGEHEVIKFLKNEK